MARRPRLHAAGRALGEQLRLGQGHAHGARFGRPDTAASGRREREQEYYVHVH